MTSNVKSCQQIFLEKFKHYFAIAQAGMHPLGPRHRHPLVDERETTAVLGWRHAGAGLASARQDGQHHAGGGRGPGWLPGAHEAPASEGEEKVTYATRGHTWEIYGHWTDNPDELRTDVFYLLK